MSNIAQISLKDRFKAWWHGYEMPVLDEGVFEGESGLGNAPKQRERPILLEEDEINAIQKLWGEGQCGPLQGDFLRNLYLPFALDQTKSVLEIGSGLGHLARKITGETHAYVTGLEADPLVATTGMAASKREGIGKEASIERFNPENLTLDRRYDAIISICSLFHVERKDHAIEAIAAATKPQGFVQLLDFAMLDGAEKRPEIKEWLRCERREPHPWSPAHLQARIKKTGLNIKTVEDSTAIFEHAVLEGFKGMLKRLPKCRSDDDVKRFVMDDTEIWARRLLALRAGGLRVMRVLATGAPL